MSQERDKRTATRLLQWLRRAIASFSIGVVCGGVCIPVVHYLAYGDVDPFGHGWPLILQASAFLSAFIITLLLRSSIASASGVYAGLVGLMFVSGASEYPMSSAVGLAVHGYLPAAFGSALALGVLYGTYGKVPPASAAKKAVNPSVGSRVL